MEGSQLGPKGIIRCKLGNIWVDISSLLGPLVEVETAVSFLVVWNPRSGPQTECQFLEYSFVLAPPPPSTPTYMHTRAHIRESTNQEALPWCLAPAERGVAMTPLLPSLPHHLFPELPSPCSSSTQCSLSRGIGGWRVAPSGERPREYERSPVGKRASFVSLKFASFVLGVSRPWRSLGKRHFRISCVHWLS